MNEAQAAKVLSLFDRYSRAEYALNRMLDRELPNGSRVEYVETDLGQYEKVRRNLATLGFPWTVKARTIEPTHVSVIRADGTTGLHEIRKLFATVQIGMLRIVKPQ